MEVFIPWFTKAQEVGMENLNAKTEYGDKCRQQVRDSIIPGRWVHEQNGTVMGYRYTSPVVIKDKEGVEPKTSITEYIPSTWPGARAPHVFLKDGKTSTFDLYGPGFSIFDFTKEGRISKAFLDVAGELRVPLTRVHLPDEEHVKAIWERDVVLVRPDGFVAWRSASQKQVGVEETRKVLGVVTGKEV